MKNCLSVLKMLRVNYLPGPSGRRKAVSYFDDVIVQQNKYQKNFELCLYRLKKYDLHLNQKECLLFQKKINILDISSNSTKFRKAQKTE